MITNFFIPELNNHDVQELWFQQDGATCHAARATIDLLKDTFGNRLISRFGPVIWPPRSCDLTPLDYFLWGYVKSLVYADKPQTLDHLEDNIRRVIADIRPQMLEKSSKIGRPDWTTSEPALHGQTSETACSLPIPSSEASAEVQQMESAVQCVNSYANGNSVEEGSNITDEEKVVAAKMSNHFDTMQRNFSLSHRPFLEAIFNALDCTENDHAVLFALCVLYALGYNPGINQELLDSVLMPSEKSETKFCYNVNLAEKLIQIINLSCQYSSKIRIATLQMTILLLKQLAVKGTESSLLDRHLAAIEQSREESTLMLRNFYKSEEIFLDMFEDEYEEMKKKVLNVEYLMMDANLLLPPTGTPMSGIEFHKRLPCGEVERARRAIRVFFLLRDLSLTLQNEEETQLPLTNISSCFKVNDALDLNNSDIINCTVITKDGQKIKGFMVIEALQLILVDPDNKRGGWGIAKFVGFLQDIEVTGDKDDSRCLHITIHRPSSIAGGSIRSPLLAAKFVFDDHIRCMAAKQRLSKGRQKARQRKLHQIARLLELPDHIQPCPSPLRHSLHSVKAADVSSLMHRSQSQDTGLRGKATSGSIRHSHCHHRPLLPSSRVPGHAAILKHSDHLPPDEKRTSERRRTSSSPSSPRRHGSRSRESSPRQSASSEEIPLEDMSRIHGSRHGSPSIRRRSTSGLPQIDPVVTSWVTAQLHLLRPLDPCNSQYAPG
ncbi:protein CLEC16A homolog [Trichonephila clavipes]|nr:protein CLEC16A homolog [Trichonephila clavipes]